jgi:fumarylpyruvate hydrolase
MTETGLMATTLNLLFPAAPVTTVPVLGKDQLFPVNRIFCVGRNYVEHAKEMGGEVDREAPFYFMKFASAIVMSGATIPYPPGTKNCHYEMEFVVAIGAPAFRIAANDAMSIVYGYAAGLDMTRRDLQAQAKEKGRPWDLAKSYEQSAIISPITPAATFGAIDDQRICMQQNGVMKQDALLSDMVWSVPDIISHLSRYYHLAAGDLIYTGTPAGVGAVQPGDTLLGEIAGLSAVKVSFSAPE